MNQRVVVNEVGSIGEAANWLDGLIGNFVNSDEIAIGIIHFQIIPVKGDSLSKGWEPN